MNQTQFGIRIDYSKEEENSSRVFHAVGGLLDGVNDIQQAVLDSTGMNLKLSSKLNDTLEGSLIGVQVNGIKNEDGSLNQRDGFLAKIQKKVLDFIGTPMQIESKEPFKELAKTLQDEVKKEFDVCEQSTMNITNIDDYRLAKGIEKSLKAIDNNLTKSDGVTIGLGSESKNPCHIIGKGISLTKSVDDIYTTTATYPHKNITLEIVNAAFSGDKWKFRWLHNLSGRKEFSAKIKHEAWLERWFNREETILPGDCLRVDLTVFMTDKGKRTNQDIEYVYGVIARNETMQLPIEEPCVDV